MLTLALSMLSVSIAPGFRPAWRVSQILESFYTPFLYPTSQILVLLRAEEMGSPSPREFGRSFQKWQSYTRPNSRGEGEPILLLRAFNYDWDL